MTHKFKLEHRVEELSGTLHSPMNYSVMGGDEFSLAAYAEEKGVRSEDIDPESVEAVKAACSGARGPVAVHVWHVQNA